MSKKKALITGITGQDGAYLAKLLLSKGYNVFGGMRENSSNSLWRLQKLNIDKSVKIIPFELLEENIINKQIRHGKFHEIYNFAAQSYVDKSFASPVYTSNVNALGVIRILEAIRHFSKSTKFFQASSSEMFGNTGHKSRDENTNFKPISPYAVSKLHSHWMVNMYREAYNLYCCSGILFNHESPLRGDNYVTQKIIRDLVRVKMKKLSHIKLGNINVRRDWGYSEDYVHAMWKMLQENKANDYVISSGHIYSLKSFINKVSQYLGFKIIWVGKNLNEKGIDKNTNKVIVKIDKKLFRPIDISYSSGNSSKARKKLKWKSETTFGDLIKLMCEAELKKYV